jgi:hypothetical protein
MRHAHLKTAMLLVALVAAGLLACSHDQLDRETAEKLIRERHELPGNPLVLVLHSPAWIDGSPSRVDATRQSNLDFLESLAKAGVIRWQPEEKVPVTFVNGSYVGGAETVRPFEAIPQENVKQRHGGPFEGDYVFLTLAVPGLKRVTGISQQEATAEVEVAVGLKPTPLNDRLQPLVVPILAHCGELPKDFLANHETDRLNFAVSAICKQWPTEGKLAFSEPFNFMFQKYDDGWRIERMMN